MSERRIDLLRALAIDSMDTEQRQNRRKLPRPGPVRRRSCILLRVQAEFLRPPPPWSDKHRNLIH